MSALELKLPPLLVLVLIAALMWLGSRAAPTLGFPTPTPRTLAASVAAAGAVIMVAGVVSFRRARTTVNPLKPESASALVTSGIYRLTRNPMYLGALGLLIGWAFFLSNLAAFILTPTFVFYLNRFQIVPEERALAARFGAEFAAYRTKVRRWL